MDRCVVPLGTEAQVPRRSAAVRRGGALASTSGTRTGDDILEAYCGGVSLGEVGLPRALINRAIGHPIDGFCQIGILVGVFVAEQHQIVQGIAPQDIAEVIGGRKLGYPGERIGTAVQFVGLGHTKRSIIHPAKSPTLGLDSEGAKRSDVEWHDASMRLVQIPALRRQRGRTGVQPTRVLFGLNP
jgi:hypothetical protein